MELINKKLVLTAMHFLTKNKKITNGFFLILLVLFAACTQVNKQNEDYNKLILTINKFYERIENGNINDRLALFSPDAIILPNNGKLYRFTAEKHQQWIVADKEWDFKLKDVAHIEIEMSGNIAYSINSYYYSYHKKGTEPKWHKTKNIHIWKKQKGGTWKLHADIWNSSADDF